MNTRDPELVLRHDVRDAMRGKWRLTWHEDKEVNPGVPDLSFVMIRGGHHQTGWIELKAIKPKTGKERFKFKIESSQHNWIRDHLGLIPIAFLVAVGDTVFLVDARHHERLDELMDIVDLQDICIQKFEKKDMGKVLPDCLDAMTQIFY